MNQLTLQKLCDDNSAQLVTFRCGDLLVGLELTDVQEINRIDRFAEVPEAPPHVRGVINLRGEVVTMIDLRVVLHQATNESGTTQHNVFVRNGNEVIGLITDGVSDILTIERDSIDPTPANVNGTDAEKLNGVHTLDTGELMVILDLEQVLSTCDD